MNGKILELKRRVDKEEERRKARRKAAATWVVIGAVSLAYAAIVIYLTRN